MSHEIRSPMNGVLGFAEMLLYGESKKEKPPVEASLLHWMIKIWRLPPQDFCIPPETVRSTESLPTISAKALRIRKAEVSLLYQVVQSSETERIRKALAITQTELRLMAAAAIMGLNSQPVNG